MLSLIVSLVILVSSAGSVLRNLPPEIAFQMNPLDTNVRLSYVGSRFKEDMSKEEYDHLLGITEGGIYLNPYDARFYSLHGALLEASGSVDDAQQYYTHALRLIPTQELALLRRFVFKVSKNNYPGAMKLAELIYQRWKSNWPLVEPFLPVLLSDQTAYDLASEIFPDRENGAISLILSLSRRPEGLNYARNLLLDWQSRELEQFPRMVNLILDALIRENRFADAYRLFFLTLTEDERKHTGYVHNSGFELPESISPFNWQFSQQPGVKITRKNTALENSDDMSLEIRFLDQPARFSGVRQYLRLPSSNFRLTIDYTNEDLVGPSPIKLGLRCSPRNLRFLEVELPKTGKEAAKKEIEFSVPEDECDFQLLWFYNTNFTKSWANRYRGSLIIHGVSIELDAG